MLCYSGPDDTHVYTRKEGAKILGKYQQERDPRPDSQTAEIFIVQKKENFKHKEIIIFKINKLQQVLSLISFK